MKQKEIHALARRLAARLIDLHEGDRDDPATWYGVASQMSCRLIDFYQIGGMEGEYAPSIVPEGSGVIQFNTALCPSAQASVIVHELAHHLLMPLVPGYVLGEYVTCRYDDDPLDVRHRIAQRVEYLIFWAS